MSPEAWSVWCGLAETHEVKLRCSRAQLPVLMDRTGRHAYITAGNRSGKTTVALNAICLHWILRGGPLRRFWLVAPTEQKAYELLKKLILGSSEGSGILPPALVVRAPASHRASNLQTVLVDGSVIDLKGFHGDPGAERLKSDPIVAAVVDESAHIGGEGDRRRAREVGENVLEALKGRCIDHHGVLYFSSTPRPVPWLKDLVYGPAKAFTALPDDDPRKISGSHPGAIWNLVQLRLEDNPWLPADQVDKAIKTADPDNPATQRDLYGNPVSNQGPAWPDFDPERHVVKNEIVRDVAKLSEKVMAGNGCPDHVVITDKVAKRLFSGRNPHYRMAKATNFKYILGHDHNFDPMNECVIQVTAPLGKEKDPDYWHIWVVGTIQLHTTNTLEWAEHVKSTAIARAFDPKGHGSPFEGCGAIVDKTCLSYDQASKNRGSFAETYGKLNLDARAPEYRDGQNGLYARNPSPARPYTIIHKLLKENRLHVYQNALPLLIAFDEQEDNGLGCPIDARAGTWDKIAGPMDAFKYPVFAIFDMDDPVTIGRL